MTPPAPSDDDSKLALQLAIIVLVSALLLNVLFFFLSGAYYDDKRATEGLMSTITDATVTGTRIRFAIFSGVISAALVGTLFEPRWVGHVLAGLIGIASLVGAVFAGGAGMPGALTVSLVIIGLLYPLLVVSSLLRTSRAAWAFLCAMCWVLFVVMLFGAPKVRVQMDTSLWLAMIIPGLLMVAAVGLTMSRHHYRDRSYR